MWSLSELVTHSNDVIGRVQSFARITRYRTHVILKETFMERTSAVIGKTEQHKQWKVILEKLYNNILYALRSFFVCLDGPVLCLYDPGHRATRDGMFSCYLAEEHVACLYGQKRCRDEAVK